MEINSPLKLLIIGIIVAVIIVIVCIIAFPHEQQRYELRIEVPTGVKITVTRASDSDNVYQTGWAQSPIVLNLKEGTYWVWYFLDYYKEVHLYEDKVVSFFE